MKGGAHIHIVDNHGLTPLMLAILTSDTMDSKVGPETLTRSKSIVEGRSSVVTKTTASVDTCVENIVRTLATGDTRLDMPDTSGRTALHLASMLEDQGLRKKLISILVEAGAPINVKDVNGDTPVDLGYRMSEHTLFD